MGRRARLLLPDAPDRAHVHLDPRGHRPHAALALRGVLRPWRDPLGHAAGLGRHGPWRTLDRHQAVAEGSRLPRGRRGRRRRRRLRLATRPEWLMDQLFAFDERLYSAIVAARDPLIAVIAITISYLNFFGLQWALLGIAMWRTRGGRRGLWVALTVFIGMVLAWASAESLKHVFQRERPFLAIPDALKPLIIEPGSYSFPSGDTALAFGAAVAFGQCFPRFRPFALLLAFAVGLSRVFVGVHYPLDALGGAIVGVVWGLLAPPIVAWVLRLYPWRAFVVPHTHWDREWYERFESFRAKLVPMVGSLLDLLEREPRFRSFTFDGQTIPLEDHLAVRPADRPRIEALVRADRLLIGPWYVLADLLLVSGEPIVRNLQEGRRVAATSRRASRVAYA